MRVMNDSGAVMYSPAEQYCSVSTSASESQLAQLFLFRMNYNNL
jgi:hypothetical protein